MKYPGGKRQIRIKDVLENLLFQYTLISLVITVSIAIVMSVLILQITETQVLKMHSSFYINYVNSIQSNYRELLSVFSGESEEQDLHAIEHFSEDLLLIPAIRNISVYGLDGTPLWRLNPEASHQSAEESINVKEAQSRAFSYSINQENEVNILSVYLPVTDGARTVGVVGIEEDIIKAYLSLGTMRKIILAVIISGGAAFYLFLFFLFLRSYRSQSSAYRKLESSQRVTIRSMSLLAELRDNETGAHITRTSSYCRVLAETLQNENKFKKYLTSEYIEDLVNSAPLHDIGKVGVPDHILLKPGKLTDEEFNIIKNHPRMGAEVLEKASATTEVRTFLKIGIQVVLHHHENWDGSGYPEKLSGKAIPLSARMMALADVYDALRTKRPYKTALSHETAVDIIKAESGKKFDPDIVNAFLSSEAEFRRISADITD